MYETHGGTHGATKAPPGADPSSPARKAGPLARARRAMLSDDRLAKEAAAGDLGAFEAIFRRYQDDLFRFCVGILREPQDAQDAVQNTMFKAMRALPGERREMQLKPWLYRIAHNEAVELRRRERPAEELLETVDVTAAGTEERAEDNGRLRILLADIADLPERQRASLVMREVNGLGFGEIGAALGTSPGAVRQALYEARRGLAEMDHGRDMQCDLATRMVSDADGRPRDRGVRAHLRDCSPCRRFQAEIRGRGRALAAISPMPAIAAIGALKAALGSGAAGGGAGATAAAGGAGAGGAGLAAGSVGAAALLKPAAGLLTVLAIGTTTVDHGAIFEAGRHDPAAARHGKSVRVPAGSAEGGWPGTSRAVAWRSGGRVATVATDAQPGSSLDRHANEPGTSALAAQRRYGADAQGDGDVVRSDGESPALDGAAHDEALMPGVQMPSVAPPTDDRSGAPSVGAEGPADADGEANNSGRPGEDAEPIGEAPSADQGTSTDVPADQAAKENDPSGQAKTEVETTEEPATTVDVPAPVPPGQAKKQAKQISEPAPTEGSTTPAVTPPGQAKTESVPPGQIKKEVESSLEGALGGSSNAAAPATEAPELPPGQAKKEDATSE